ncbi:DsrE family protein [Desulforamulus aquiferis]|uniref:DsrE family protein n=1 Tax=Desulforamulus aquiferis TaxID=1397668 RepID=A0AAW7ZE72_9FIRM|nr:DsrE family protein [Desulforamulus aquiferis]MDO7787696.1 DsrE family protein [Desulforamulus aquiferis]RYD05915.1 hypothetical protein N752_06635 [Desulforamulus aquiferis]
MEKTKVLFHVSENEVWPKALTNIQNFLKDVSDNQVEIELVANAGAVNFYYDNDKVNLHEQMSSLSSRGVKFAACRNALQAHSLKEELLPEFVQVVPGGITEIVKKQSMGFIYIKP